MGFVARCSRFGGCELRIFSDSFKRCFTDALRMARTKLYHDSDIDCLVFELGGWDDLICYIAISRSGYTIDMLGGRVFDIDRAGWKSVQTGKEV